MGELPKVSQTQIEEFMQQTYQTSSNKLEEANKSKKVFSCNISCDFQSSDQIIIHPYDLLCCMVINEYNADDADYDDNQYYDDSDADDDEYLLQQ